MASEERAVLLRHLKNAEKFSRPPKHLKRSFKATSQQNKTETSRIFLEAGYQAWLAYFLATNAVRGKSHFQGKAEDARLISSLCERSSQVKQDIATGVSEEELNNIIEGRVEAWAKDCGYHEWLEGTAATTYSDSEDSSMADSPKEIVTPPQEHLASVSSRQSVSQEYEGHLLASSAPDQRIAIPHDPAMPPEAALVQQMPAATVIGVMDVFPPYICGAVIKNHALNVAMVQMAFPRFPSDDCLMILTIQPNKVEYLAMALFGIHLETEDEQRYLVLQNGSRVVPSNQMSLEGAEEGAVTTILGQTISSAIQHSWKRTLEIGNAARTTRCVTMGVGMKSDAPALLNLWLGLERGVELRHKLYV